MGASHAAEARSNEQRILLRKLQNVESKTKPVTWNEVLAGVVVDSVKGISSEKVKQEPISNETYEKKEDFLLNFFSNTLFLFKKYFYDKFIETHDSPPIRNPEIWTGDTDFALDPGKDVEVFEPKYHGKTSAANSTEESDCPNGSFKNADGRCVALLMIAIPNQCPRGYRRDRLGYCRLSF